MTLLEYYLFIAAVLAMIYWITMMVKATIRTIRKDRRGNDQMICPGAAKGCKLKECIHYGEHRLFKEYCKLACNGRGGIPGSHCVPVQEILPFSGGEIK